MLRDLVGALDGGVARLHGEVLARAARRDFRDDFVPRGRGPRFGDALYRPRADPSETLDRALRKLLSSLASNFRKARSSASLGSSARGR